MGSYLGLIIEPTKFNIKNICGDPLLYYVVEHHGGTDPRKIFSHIVWLYILHACKIGFAIYIIILHEQ